MGRYLVTITHSGLSPPGRGQPLQSEGDNTMCVWYGISPPVQGQHKKEMSGTIRVRLSPWEGLSPPAQGQQGHAHLASRHQSRTWAIPPVRGQRCGLLLTDKGCRAIPARAGPTTWAGQFSFGTKEYPRQHGANPDRGTEQRRRKGLSPPVRGPTWAGTWSPSITAAYPRPCGASPTNLILAIIYLPGLATGPGGLRPACAGWLT